MSHHDGHPANPKRVMSEYDMQHSCCVCALDGGWLAIIHLRFPLAASTCTSSQAAFSRKMTFLNKIIDKAKSHQHSNHSSVSSTASTQQPSTTSSKELHNTQPNHQLPSDHSNNQLPEDQKPQPEMTPSSSEATRMSLDNSSECYTKSVETSSKRWIVYTARISSIKR